MCLVKAADKPFAKIATMKPIHVLGITLQGEGNGSFYENKRTNANVEAFAREAFNDAPAPVDHPTAVSGSSWEDPPQNVIDNWVRAIKSFVHSHRPRPALLVSISH